MYLKLQIQSIRQELRPIKTIPTRIKGHQDDKGGFDYNKAPTAAQCNIDADIVEFDI